MRSVGRSLPPFTYIPSSVTGGEGGLQKRTKKATPALDGGKDEGKALIPSCSSLLTMLE